MKPLALYEGSAEAVAEQAGKVDFAKLTQWFFEQTTAFAEDEPGAGRSSSCWP